MRGVQLRSLSAACTVLLLMLAACAGSKPTLRSDADRNTDFTAYHTFNFSPQLGTDRSGYSSLVSSYFKQATQREMESRGYRYSEAAPDLLVNFNTNVREVADVYSTPSASYGYYGYRTYGGMHTSSDVETVRYKVGTVNVDLIDAHKNQLVWEGVAEGELTKKVMENPQAAIDKVVQELFQRFPVKVAAPATPAQAPST